MSKRQRKFLINDEQTYAIGVHLSHVDVIGNACTAVANVRQRAFAQTRLLLSGPTFVKCIRSLRKMYIYPQSISFRGSLYGPKLS